MEKILIANRGEIAVRIMRSAREMGIKTVVVYSEADKNALHTRFADESYYIGSAPARESYLVGEKIIGVAKKSDADAIHPGYGFLSENSKFARMVRDAGLIFIGPSPEAMEIMGDKIAAKKSVEKYKVPLVPGTSEAITDASEAKKQAQKIGFPVLIKASSGGGGKGMRIVQNEKNFEEELKRASSEAISAFGDGSVFIEKYISSPRHIEFQILADTHGNIVHLFERECSVQRRHQKVIEEAPSSVLTPELRKKMGECAVNVAKACGYTNAGTVEFLVENSPSPTLPKGEREKNNKPFPSGRDGDGLFYFLEMNTRLQVEHPVTEMITGLDLVKEQIKIARGEKLSFKQNDLKINGHAIESRIYAEDPFNNFLPDIGTLEIYRQPQGTGIRCDNGYEEGMEIPIQYDPLLAKLITHGKNREEAITKMIRAIDEFEIAGVETTLPFCCFVMEHPVFRDGKFDTHFVEKYFSPEKLEQPLTQEEEKISALAGTILYEKVQSSSALGGRVQRENFYSSEKNKWKKNRKEYRSPSFSSPKGRN